MIGEKGDAHRILTRTWLFRRPTMGLGSVYIAQEAYNASLEYAKERPQGRKVTTKDPTQPQIPIIGHADIKRMLLFQRAVVDGSICLALQCAKYVDLITVLDGEERGKYSLLLDLLTPIAKTYPSEMGILSVSAGLQCLGGYGYCDEFPLEQYYRDVRIHPIHEGTTGIQGMDLLGRKVVMQNGKALMLWLEEVEKTIKEAKDIKELIPYAEALEEAIEKLKEVTTHLTGIALEGKIELFLADATLYLEFFGIVTIAWQWLLQAITAHKALAKGQPEAEANFYKGKLYAFRFFFSYELPKIEGLAKRLKVSDGLTVEMKEEFFAD
jgi:butyryl-CoA dehydrogenase